MSVEITTDRLTLRPFRASDAEVVARLLNNLNVSQWLTLVPYPYTEQDALTFFDAGNDKAALVLAVCDEDGLVGCVSTKPDLGYWYGEPFWGRGYATEAARALTLRHFATASDALLSGYHLGNAASQKVLEKLGFANTGKRTAFSRSQQCDVTIQEMILTRAQWEAVA